MCSCVSLSCLFLITGGNVLQITHKVSGRFNHYDPTTACELWRHAVYQCHCTVRQQSQLAV